SPDLGERLDDAGGRVGVHDGNQLRGTYLETLDDLIRLDDPTPWDVHRVNLGAVAAGDLAEQIAEPAKIADDHPVAGFDQACQRRFEAGPRRPGDGNGAPVRRPEHPP